MRTTVDMSMENILLSLDLLSAGHRYVCVKACVLCVSVCIVNVQKGSGTFPIPPELSNKDVNKKALSTTQFK